MTYRTIHTTYGLRTMAQAEAAGVPIFFINKKPKELSGANNYVNLVIGFTEIPV